MRTSPTARGTPLRTKFGIFLFFASIYLALTPGHFWSTDHVAVYLTTQNLVEEHDPSIKLINDAAKGRNGKWYSNFGFGQAIAAVPLYVVGASVDEHGSTAVRDYFRGPDIGDWGGTVQIFFVSLFNQLVVPLVCVLLFMLLLELGVPRPSALFTTLLFGLGTSAFVAAHEFFQHPLETLLLLGSVYALVAGRAALTPRRTFVAGSLLGLGIFTRLNVILAVPALVAYALWLHHVRSQVTYRTLSTDQARVFWRSQHRPVSALVRESSQFVGSFLLPVGVVLIVIMYLNYSRFGDALAFNRGVAAHGFSLRTTPVGLYGNLLSPGRGIFLYSPPLVLGFVGARRFYDLHKPEALLFAAVCLTYVAFYSTYNWWHGGWSWGPRYLLPIVAILMVPAAYSLTSASMRFIAGVLLAVGLGVQVLGTAVNVSYATWAHWGGQVTESMLFVPGDSPVPAHLHDLLRNRNIDLWVLYVRDEFGTGAFLLTLAIPIVMCAGAMLLLWPRGALLNREAEDRLRRTATSDPSRDPWQGVGVSGTQDRSADR